MSWASRCSCSCSRARRLSCSSRLASSAIWAASLIFFWRSSCLSARSASLSSACFIFLIRRSRSSSGRSSRDLTTSSIAFLLSACWVPASLDLLARILLAASFILPAALLCCPFAAADFIALASASSLGRASARRCSLSKSCSVRSANLFCSSASLSTSALLLASSLSTGWPRVSSASFSVCFCSSVCSCKIDLASPLTSRELLHGSSSLSNSSSVFLTSS